MNAGFKEWKLVVRGVSMLLVCLGLSIGSVESVYAQSTAQQYTISGTVRDLQSGEEMIRVTIRVDELPTKGGYTNKHGFYSLTLPKGEYTLRFQYIGYRSTVKKVSLDKSQSVDIQMVPTPRTTKDVVVTAEKKNDNITNTRVGVERVDIQDVRNVPVLLGERDVIKTIQLLPGVKAAAEGNSGISVRGGNTDQNLILLDDAPVYNASHLLGFFSTFNSDAIKDVTLYKAGMPAQFGGRISSVLDIQMNEGNTKKYVASGSIGLLSSKILVEGPIQDERSSFLLAARRTYADVFLALSSDESVRNSSLYFYDLNAKVNYQLSSGDRLFLSGYFGRDALGFNKTFGIDWGNATGTLRWNHQWSEKLVSNSSLIYSNYDYNIDLSLGGSGFNIYSRIRDWNFQQQFEYFHNPENTMTFGVNGIYHSIVPGVISVTGSDAGISAQEWQTQRSLESAAFFSHSLHLSDALKCEYGVRLVDFAVLGGNDQYVLDAQRKVIDTLHTTTGSIVKNFFRVEPRLSLSYVLDENQSIKASLGRNSQMMHLLSTSTTSSPTDRWISSNNNIDPQGSDQISFGYFRNFSLDDESQDYELSAETYFKTLTKQIDYKDAAEINTTESPETEILVGDGRAYGLELMLKKKTGRLSGWISYSLSRSERQINGINNNQWYPFKYDRTHDLAIVGMYKLNEEWSISANFVYNSGNAVTFPSGKYVVDGNIVFYYTERNGYRMPAYHRLDIGANWTLGPKSELNFSVYNVYGRENAYTIDFQKDPNDPSKTQALRTALFKYVPSVSYSFRF